MPKTPLIPAALLCAALLAGCTTARSTAPLRTAGEQLLISAAADRAAAQLSLGIPKGTRIFVDSQYFQGYDQGYAIAAIRTQMLKNGLMLVDDRKQAEAVVRFMNIKVVIAGAVHQFRGVLHHPEEIIHSK